MSDALCRIFEEDCIEDCCKVDLKLHFREEDAAVDALIHANSDEAVPLLVRCLEPQVLLLGYEEGFYLIGRQSEDVFFSGFAIRRELESDEV